MRTPYAAVALAALLSLAPATQAVEQNRVALDTLGTNSFSEFNFSIAETLAVTCRFNLIFGTMNTVGGRAMYAMLLLAKALEKPLDRVVYAQTDTTNPAGPKCVAQIVSID